MKRDKLLYCIMCERMVAPEDGIFGHTIVVQPDPAYPAEVDLCEFPGGWATCPPPPMEEGWEEYVEE